MQILNLLEKKLEKYTIANLTNILIIGQVCVYIIISLFPHLASLFFLQGDKVFAGEWFRLFTFLFKPFFESPILIAFTWYMYYLLGNALEHIWGTFRYTLYLLIAYLATIISAFIFPNVFLSNQYIFTSLFLAFAYLNPNFTVSLFFLVPIKIVWFGVLTWFGIIATIISGPIQDKTLALLSVTNFLLFFGRDIFSHKKLVTIPKTNTHFMECATCHKTEHDKKIFSYCKACKPETQYCEDHIKTHEHKK